MTRTSTTVPDDLPVPEDDGAAAHLTGASLPRLTLTATDGRAIDLSRLAGLRVLYVYPRTGRPDVATPTGWNEIPGARGCTPQSCSYRDHYAELDALGAGVFGISAQDCDYQREARVRLQLPFQLLSDPQLGLAQALGLPTFEAAGMWLFKRLTLITRDARIEKVFYPVFPPDSDAQQVLAWLQRNAV